MTVPWQPWGPIPKPARKMLCADIGLPSARDMLWRLSQVCVDWGIYEDYREAVTEKAVGWSGADVDNLVIDWHTAAQLIDEVATAKRCLCSPHRGPAEALIHVERLESTLMNAERSPW